MGGGKGYGATHSQSIEKFFLGMPGLCVVAPSHVHSPGLEMKRAINSSRPTLFIEHKQLYGVELFSGSPSCTVTEITAETDSPIKMVRNFHKGDPDVVIATYGGLSRLLTPLLEDWAEEEVKISLILPSEISSVPATSIANETSKAGRLMIIEDGTAGFGWGAEIAATVYDMIGSRLHVPIKRLAAKPAIIPCCAAGEDAALVSREMIETALMDLLA